MRSSEEVVGRRLIPILFINFKKETFSFACFHFFCIASSAGLFLHN